MPKYKNSFKNPEYFDHTIIDEGGKILGTVRIKPSGILWKPNNARQFYTVDLETFSNWITHRDTRANRTTN